MTKIKLCGLSRTCDAETANLLMPDLVGFVFAKKSRRYVTGETAAQLRSVLDPGIKTVGVFVREDAETVASYVRRGIIDIVQLHGGEGSEYIKKLRTLTDAPIIKAYRIDTAEDAKAAEASEGDIVLLDSGEGGTGTAFDRLLIADVRRPYFLAGGLDSTNVGAAVRELRPYGVDVSSGIETNGVKDAEKMKEFVFSVRENDA